MRIFIDTSALYALLDGDDNNHAKAKKAWGEIRRRGGGQIFILDYLVIVVYGRTGGNVVKFFK